MNLIDDWQKAMPKQTKTTSSSSGPSDLLAAMLNLQEVLAALPNSRAELERLVDAARAVLDEVNEQLAAARAEIEADVENRLTLAIDPVTAAQRRWVADQQRAAARQREQVDEIAETAAEISRRLVTVESALDSVESSLGSVLGEEKPDVAALVNGRIDVAAEQWKKALDGLEQRVQALAKSVTETANRKIPTMVSAPPAFAKVFQDGTLVGEIREVDFVGATVTKNRQRATVTIEGGGEGGSMTGAQILAALASVDGSGSGLDSDLLDNLTSSYLLDRANHSGAQAISTVTDLQTALDARVLASWRQVKRKTAAETVNNSAVLQDDDHLTFAIGASEGWVGQIILFATAPTATADLQIALTAPAGATLIWTAFAQRSADALLTNHSAVTTSGTGLTIQNGLAGGSTHMIHIGFRVLNSTTPGSVTMQWSQAAATASNSTLEAGSFLIAERTV